MEKKRGDDREADAVVGAAVEDAREGALVDVAAGRIMAQDDGVVKEEVFLRIYDLSQGAAKALSKQLLGLELEGIWHTSIEAYGNEYYFQNGLAIAKAGTTHYGVYVERISLGHTDCSMTSLEEYFELSRHSWTPESYDLFENNCNNFSNYLADFLVQKGIPPHILELPSLVKHSPGFRRLFGMRRE